jgi:predicted RND superfamily exporter protein
VGITTVFGILASLGLTLFVVPTLLEIGKAKVKA